MCKNNNVAAIFPKLDYSKYTCATLNVLAFNVLVMFGTFYITLVYITLSFFRKNIDKIRNLRQRLVDTE